LTDNLNRAAADIRTVVNKNKMKIGAPGSVAFNFDRKGVIRVNADHVSDADELLLAASEAGAEECDLDPFNPEQYLISTKLEDLKSTRAALVDAGYSIDLFQLEMIPKTTTEVSEGDFDLNARAMEQLEDLDDVDSVFSNIAAPTD
jgi:transcriptional/translational regulatory protein YebC/TACO1